MRHPGFDALVQELAPDGRLHSLRRLKGGLGARVDLLTIEQPDGVRHRVTLRRALPEYRHATVERFTANYGCLELLERAGVPAPRPLLLDADGRFFGVPCLVQSYIPGSSRYQPSQRGRGRWARELAAAAASVHAVTPRTHDLSDLRRISRDDLLKVLDDWLADEEAAVSPLAERVIAVLRDRASTVAWPEPALVHDDFWPGNTVWFRNRCVAVIDWEDAAIGDPRTDVAQAQLEIAFTLDRDLADTFVAEYEAIAGTLPDLWYFQLYRGLGALLWVYKWLAGYADAGLALDPIAVHREVEAFVMRALNMAESSSV